MKFNPNRLSIARKRRLLKKKDLALRANLSDHTVHRCEGGKTEPTKENVAALAAALNFPVSFFYNADIDEATSDITSFRSQTSMTAVIRDAALAAGSLGFLISDWVEERFDLPEVKVPDLHQFEPDVAASVLRQEWELGERPISNMIQLLESKGVRVFSLAENTATVNAYSLWRAEKPYVFLNTFKSAESSRFDAAHELAHLVLHQDGKVTGRAAEDQAHRFASAFLMPKADVLAVLPSVTHLSQLIQAKLRWRVSVAALNHRLYKLGVITEWKNRDFCIELSRRGYHRNEPLGIERERSAVWTKVLTALWAEGTSHHDIARELSIPEGEIDTLLFGILQAPAPAATGDAQLSVVDSAVDRV